MSSVWLASSRELGTGELEAVSAARAAARRRSATSPANVLNVFWNTGNSYSKILELEDHALRFLKGMLHICHPTYLAMRTDPYSDIGRPRENWQRPRDEAKPADDRRGGIALLHIAGLCGAVRLPVETSN